MTLAIARVENDIVSVTCSDCRESTRIAVPKVRWVSESCTHCGAPIVTYCVGIAADDVPFGEFFVLPRKPRARSAAPDAVPPTRLAVLQAITVAVPIAVIIGVLGASLKLSVWWLWAVLGGGVGYCIRFLKAANRLLKKSIFD
ncbi:MAG TPA: hypothetical protein VGR95_02270 [Thermoanaerobaculia bacterium]|nr:hypothetical protein [Thermoanaerobaculia bacterium]